MNKSYYYILSEITLKIGFCLEVIYEVCKNYETWHRYMGYILQAKYSVGMEMKGMV